MLSAALTPNQARIFRSRISLSRVGLRWTWVSMIARKARLELESKTGRKVVSGDDDLTFLPEESRALAELLPHGRYHEVASAGHLPFIEQPAAFIRAVNDFFAV